jgi:hypothetical protein
MAIARPYVAVQWPYAYDMQNTCLAVPSCYAGEILDVNLMQTARVICLGFFQVCQTTHVMFPGMPDNSRDVSRYARQLT